LFFIFIICSINILGYYHADEHFQLIEFSGIKNGFNSPEFLSWEYDDKLRSSAQIFISYITIETCKIVSIDNPYHQMIALKILSSIFAFMVINYFIKSTKHLFSNSIITYKIISLSLWFIPIISIRFSSETWGGICFLLAMAFLQDKYINIKSRSVNTFVILGFLLGLSFLLRFQTVFMSFGLILWLFFLKKESFKTAILILFGGAIALTIGVLLDFWFYQTWTFTFWNYFYGNIINDIASNFGTSPWYYYITKIWEIPIFGLLIILSFIYFTIKKYKTVYFWLIIPFFLIHSFVGHKEFRFIFPLAFFAPLILMTFYHFIDSKISQKYAAIKYSLLGILILINFSFLTIYVLKGEDDNGRHTITKLFYDNYQEKPINIISTGYSSPYSPFRANPRFYLTPNIYETRIGSICDLNKNALKKDTLNFFCCRKIFLDINPDCIKNIQKLGFVKVKQSINPQVEKLIHNYYDNTFGAEILVLYKQEN